MKTMVFLFFLIVSLESKKLEVDERSPYFQHLPGELLFSCEIIQSLWFFSPQDCKNENNVTIVKKTTMKGIVCPMIKDEEGFLSEWAGKSP